jgi:CDP-glycerol glycerophosphotransferase (TagB/SpsB family)
MWKIYKEYENLNLKSRIKNFGGYVINATKKRIPTEIFKRIREIFYLISIKDILDVFFLPVVLLINIFCKRKLKKQKIWIIEENPNEACDNGYIFFKYITEKRKDINCYYVINKKSKDYIKVKQLGNVIKHRSLKHWLYYLNAEKIIVTQKYANPSPAIFYILHTKNIIKTPRIFLQHGVIKDDGPWVYYPKTNFRIFICGAKREYEYVKSKFLYPRENVAYTGLARFDNLDLNKKDKSNMILIAPTWRKWIKNGEDNFFEKYNSLSLNFILHKNMKKYKEKIKASSNRIIVKNNNEVDIQELLNKTDLLITDFSSIAMDIAYIQKPIIYYQFDKAKYRNEHLPEGYYSYEDDGFGDIVTDENVLIKKINVYVQNNFQTEDKYLKRMQEFFERRDKDNCKRILEVIENV